MMRYRTLDVRLWGDTKFRALSRIQPSGQALFLYLLTNPNTTSIPGLFRAGAAGMAEELGWTTEGFLEAFREVMAEGLVKADLDSRVIFIPNAIKFNKPQSINVVKSWHYHWDEIPECPLKFEAYQILKDFIKGMGNAFLDAFVLACHVTQVEPCVIQEQDQKQDQDQNLSSLREEAVKPPVCPHTELVALYHKILPMCPQMRIWHKTRRNHLQSRWRQSVEYQNLEWWQRFFEYIKESDFLIGKTSSRDGKPPFIADLDWIVRPNNFAKIIEGKYHQVQS